ncbi:MAG: PIG-L family deacetylase [Gemmatimonadetes bacterium]|nr:PIG-L family deacetylase [Gemmatimonadota bacterium]
MHRRNSILGAVLGAILIVSPAQAQAPVLEHEGAAAVGLALRRLGVAHRVLMVGAHPDDENTAFLSELALGRGADVAYLSLTRGEGGQNLIGPELQEGLGLIRTDELLAARRLDGALQYFTRAYDYGYSKSADEAFRHWPHDELLADVVAVVRRFRPDLIVPVFSGTSSDGHGQHQASGIVAREAFDAAADPSFAPAQIASGLLPHRARGVMQALYRPNAATPLFLSTGDLDPLLGRSHFQIAMASRSRHRSQDMGQAEPVGPQATGLQPVAGDLPAQPSSVFDGVDGMLSARAALLGLPGGVRDALRRYETQVAQLASSFNPLRTRSLVAPLGEALTMLDRVVAMLPASDAARTFRFHLDAERGDVVHALRLAAGVILDVTTDDARIVPGQAFVLTVRLWNGGDAPIDVRAMEPTLPAGWVAEPLGTSPLSVAAGEVETRRFRVRVATDARPDEAFYLREPRAGDMYTWPDDPALRGLPFGPPPVRAQASVVLAGHVVRTENEATLVDVHKALGERRIPVRVVPAASIAVWPGTGIVPLVESARASDAEPTRIATGPPRNLARSVSVRIETEAPAGIEGKVSVDAPPGWRVEPLVAAVALKRPGEQKTVEFRVTPPAALNAGEYRVRAVLETEHAWYVRGYRLIDYPHTQPRLLFAPAETPFHAFPVRVADGLRVGYIEGAGDDGPEALRQLGVAVEPLDAAALASSDLSRFHAIVAGTRAYEVRPDLIESNARLLEYVEKGGAFIVQYNKHEYVEGGFAPYALTMAPSASRVADESSPVEILDPAHPLMTTPNVIGPHDFEGWVQERGLYFAETWAEPFKPLLALTDPGEPPLEGSLLVAPHGQGTYVYVALSFFRQWPAGVPGAYRLLANLVSIGRR